MAEAGVLRVGDDVRWRPSWGFAPEYPAPVPVERIEVDGETVDAISWDRVTGWDGEVYVDLANGHWAYGDQLSPATKEGERE